MEGRGRKGEGAFLPVNLSSSSLHIRWAGWGCLSVGNMLYLTCFLLSPADIRMSKPAEDEKPGADFPGESTGNHFETALCVALISVIVMCHH